MRRLAMDFQPIFMAGYSLKSSDSSHWERRVRPGVVPASNATCSICGFIAEERRLIHADEVWAFPGPPDVSLIDVRALCTRCHEAKDFAQTLLMIKTGLRNPQSESQVRAHYCEVNGCDERAFDADFATALAMKHELEESYGINCQIKVDYGQWGRPKETPRLTPEEQRLLKKVFETVDEPLLISGRKFSTYRAAVKTMQEIPLEQRAAFFAEFRSALEPDDEEDFEMFPDHECPWDIKMMRD